MRIRPSPKRQSRQAPSCDQFVPQVPPLSSQIFLVGRSDRPQITANGRVSAIARPQEPFSQAEAGQYQVGSSNTTSMLQESVRLSPSPKKGSTLCSSQLGKINNLPISGLMYCCVGG